MAAVYEIRVREHLDNCWAHRFDGFFITHEEDGTTVLIGPVRDQAALHGLLCRVRDLGLTLVSVNRTEEKT
jgi:cell division septation protein DedD